MDRLSIALFVLATFSTYFCMDKDITENKVVHTMYAIISVGSIIAFGIRIVSLI